MRSRLIERPLGPFPLTGKGKDRIGGANARLHPGATTLLASRAPQPPGDFHRPRLDLGTISSWKVSTPFATFPLLGGRRVPTQPGRKTRQSGLSLAIWDGKTYPYLLMRSQEHQ